VQTRGEHFITKRVQRILIGAPDGPPSGIHHHEIAMRPRAHAGIVKKSGGEQQK
jgi:hypothetical protein